MYSKDEINGALPKFPTGLKEAPISRISLGKLLAKDASESRRLYEACRTYGFFYMDLTDCVEGEELLKQSEQLLELSKAAFKISDEVKNSIHQNKTNCIFGFKAAGITAASDPHKRKDRGEMLNISKNDTIRDQPSIPYPHQLWNEKPLFGSFSRNAHTIGMNVLELLASHLNIAPTELARRHRFEAESGDHTRLTWGPASADPMPKSEAETKITTYAHTDFGSVTLLFNWLGGLQIEDGATGEWQWVRPLPGHAIYNMGDAMVEFSGGRLNSGKHRVLAAPGEQARLERYSIVYFVRPEDDVYLEDLTPEGKATAKSGDKYKAKDWITMKAQSIGNTFGSKSSD